MAFLIKTSKTLPLLSLLPNVSNKKISVISKSDFAQSINLLFVSEYMFLYFESRSCRYDDVEIMRFKPFFFKTIQSERGK